MSLLSRTKGYFVVICVLMCGFLLTFSWRLLSSNSYDTTLQRASPSPPRINLRQLQRNSSLTNADGHPPRDIPRDASPNHSSKLETLQSDSKFSNVPTNKSGTQNELEIILSQIHELGLSAKEFKNKFSIWQKQENGVSMTNSKGFSDKKSVINDPTFHTTDRKDITDEHFDKFLDKSEMTKNPLKSESDSNTTKFELSNHDNTFRRDRDGITRTVQSQIQRKKYLQLLREKFELSKRNETQPKINTSIANSISPENTNVNSVTKRFHANRYKTVSTSIVKQNESDIGNIRPTKKLFKDLSNSYPAFANIPQDDILPHIRGTQRPDYCRGCFDFEFPIIIDHPKLCRYFKDAGSRRVFLLLLIASAPGNYHARTVIRQTWGAKCQEPDSDFKCIFVIGLANTENENAKVRLENDHHNDILQIGFKDSYANLTYKTVSALKWTTNNCYSAKYVMKGDDDMYINTDLIPIMLQAAPSRKFMGGSCWGSSSPNRDVSSKWFVSLKSFHKPKFPPMCSGTGYIMSMDVLRSVLFASRNVPFFHLEDVYVALCLQKYGILPVNIMGFSNMFQEFGACNYKNGVMTSHQVPPELLQEFWTSMQKCPRANISPSQLYIIMPYPDTD